MWRALALLLSIAIIGGAALVVYEAVSRGTTSAREVGSGMGAPASDRGETRTFTVEPGSTARDIAEDLERQGLIRSALVFRLLVSQRGVGESITAGDYELSPTMSADEVVEVLAKGKVKQPPTIVVVEGWRAEEVDQKLSDLGLAAPGALIDLVRSPDRVRVPESLVAQGSTLEGFLFPATYTWDRKTGLDGFLVSMLAQFDARVDDALRQQLQSRGLTLLQAITLASVVEREAVRADERPVIASVFLNRLKAGMPLQADPTVQFAVASRNHAESARSGWWRELSVADLQTDSPFNTYRVKSLPPNPICSPGLASIKAVAEPASTDFFYFVARGDGSHAFARTNEEHAENVRRYINSTSGNR